MLEPTLDSSELEVALAYKRQKKEGLLPGRIEGALTNSLALPEPTLDSSELEVALAYIRQKKEGLLPGRIKGGCITSSALPRVHSEEGRTLAR